MNIVNVVIFSVVCASTALADEDVDVFLQDFERNETVYSYDVPSTNSYSSSDSYRAYENEYMMDELYERQHELEMENKRRAISEEKWNEANERCIRMNRVKSMTGMECIGVRKY